MFRRGLRILVQHRKKILRHTLLVQRVFNKFRNSSFNSDARSQFFFQRRPAVRQIIHRLACLCDGAILFALVAFGVQPHEGRAQQGLQFRVRFLRQRVPNFLRSFSQQASANFRQQIRELR